MRKGKLRSLIFSVFLIFVSGCAQMSSQINVVPTSEGPRWDKFESSEIKGGLPGKEYPLFKHNMPKVTWEGHFKPWSFVSGAVFEARWIDPEGKIFWEEEFSWEDGDYQTYHTSIPVWASPAKNYPGLWQVRIYYKDTLIDQKKFYIEPYDPNDIAPPPGQPQVTRARHGWADFEEKGRKQTRLFSDNFETAKKYFDDGNYPESEKYLKIILSEEPDHSGIRLALASVYARQANWDSCLEQLDIVIQDPEFSGMASKLKELVVERKKETKR